MISECAKFHADIPSRYRCNIPRIRTRGIWGRKGKKEPTTDSPRDTHTDNEARDDKEGCTHPYTGARVSSTYARTHVPTPSRFLSKPSAAFYVYLFLLLFLCIYMIVDKERLLDFGRERITTRIGGQQLHLHESPREE